MSAVSFERYLKILGRGNVHSARDPEPDCSSLKDLSASQTQQAGIFNAPGGKSSVQFPKSLSA